MQTVNLLLPQPVPTKRALRKLVRAGEESKKVIQDDLATAGLPARKTSSVATGCFITGWDALRPSTCLDGPGHCRKAAEALATASRQGRGGGWERPRRKRAPSFSLSKSPGEIQEPHREGPQRLANLPLEAEA